MQDSLKALELSLLFLKKAAADPYYWKWVLVALHNSIQGFMVCSLRGEDGLSVLKDQIATKVIAARKNNTPLPKLELDTFLNLYSKVQTDRMLINPQSKKFNPGENHNRSIRHLNRLRNHFVHFTPKSWSMEISTLPLMTQNCLKVIHFLVFSSGNINFTNQDMADSMTKTLDELESLLDRLQVQ